MRIEIVASSKRISSTFDILALNYAFLGAWVPEKELLANTLTPGIFFSSCIFEKPTVQAHALFKDVVPIRSDHTPARAISVEHSIPVLISLTVPLALSVLSYPFVVFLAGTAFSIIR